MVKCTLCGCEQYKTVYKGQDSLAQELLRYTSNVDDVAFLQGVENRLVECRQCGSRFLAEGLDGKALGTMYQLWYDLGYKRLAASTDYSCQRIREFRQYFFPYVKKYLIPGSRLLDVGCGSGLFLKVCEEDGVACSGIEWDESAAQLARCYSSAEIFVGDFRNFSLQEKFGMITMLDYIEHSQEPAEDLAYAYKLLDDNGILFIRTPNVRSLQQQVMGQKWYGLISLHLFYFDKASLKKLLEKAGFEVVIMDCQNYTSIGSFFVDKAKYIFQKYKSISARTGSAAANSRVESGVVAVRPAQYVYGMFMELVDLLGGCLDMGNNLTVIARKKQ